jgi:hypothetical protein
MSIRIGNSCMNCEALKDNKMCTKHQVKVSPGYTCDSFAMRASLKNDPNCNTCSRFENTSCANPNKASENMLCSHWAPLSATA